MKSIAQKIILGVLVTATLLGSTFAFASGGDLGGGGKIANDLRLTREEIASLKNARSSDEAYSQWRQILKRDARDQKLLQNVFNEIVLPQID
jgi:hypothetical protein